MPHLAHLPVEFLAGGGHGRFGRLLLPADGLVLLADLAGFGLELAGLLVELLLPDRQLLAPAAQLFLQRLAGFLLAGQSGLALLDGDAVGGQLFLQFKDLGGPAFQLGRQGGLLGRLGIQPLGRCADVVSSADSFSCNSRSRATDAWTSLL